MAHHNQDWDNLGRNIQDVVDRAINSQDYQRLNQTIRQVVDRAIDMGSEAVRMAADGVSGSGRTGHQNVRRLYGGTVGKTVKGVAKAFFGVPITFFSALALLGWMISGQPIVEVAGSIIFVLGLLAAGGWLTYSGVSTLKMVQRFKVYRRTLGQKTYCSLEKLARSVNKKEDFVRRDLLRMIAQGLFREGHMDKEETCLITSHETFDQFEQSRLQLEERQRQEAAAKARHTPADRDPQVQEVLDRGNAFIVQIRKCNDDIPGVEISEKISRIELIVQRIFDRVENHPEIVPDLKKLMDYYLPMTVKLLKAYADMDAQPVQGENILASKREIEASLDTLNLAFEKLLDDLFMDTALDVSSDISVLNTLLAQEGLTADDFS